MKRNLSPARGSVYLIAFVAIVVVVIYTGCKSDTNKNGSAEQTLTGPSPSPSPTPSSSPKKRVLPGDTIIVIKDGSVHIEVSDTLCADDPDPMHPEWTKYKCDRIELDDVVVKVEDKGLPPLRCPKGHGNATVKIDGGGGTKEIEVKGNGNHVTIRFRKDDYPLCDPAVPFIHCGSNNVGTVTVDTAFSKTCEPGASGDKCEIWVRKK